MYKLYESEVEDSMKVWLYRDIFVHYFNLSFGRPRANSCATCDKLAAQLSDPELQDAKGNAWKNKKFIVALWSYTIQRGFTSKIHQRFLVSSHSFLSWNRDFSHIEKIKRTHINEIRTSEDWIRLTKSASHEIQFVVLPMKIIEVVDLASFTDEMFCRPQASAGLKMRQSTEICIYKDKLFVVQCKYTYNDLESYTSFNIPKTGRPRILPRLVCKYKEPVAVAPAKVK
ncbi:hypothetical protein PR048_013018 [Dryococelus australis]|uniref:Uncharacterized protein n=1 Tax=Dryococelus australis TaxID=614101 RepID=A0ABQ9HRU4_9NEOP|nr:hypothetical protein PR048_013018 [Dryococelus australis]